MLVRLLWISLYHTYAFGFFVLAIHSSTLNHEQFTDVEPCLQHIVLACISQQVYVLLRNSRLQVDRTVHWRVRPCLYNLDKFFGLFRFGRTEIKDSITFTSPDWIFFDPIPSLAELVRFWQIQAIKTYSNLLQECVLPIRVFFL